MMKSPIIVVALFLLAITSCEGKGKKDKTLDGQLVESSSLPLLLSCAKKYKYILVGGITVNGTIMSEEQQATAVKECDEQLTDPKYKSPYPSMTTCSVTLGINGSLENSGTVRGIYRCVSSKPGKAGKHKWVIDEETTILDAKRSKNKITFSCSGHKDIIEVQQVSKAGENISAKELTSYKQEILKECYRQTVENVKKGSKANVKCVVEYSTAQKDGLEMKYRCVEPVLRAAEETYVTA